MAKVNIRESLGRIDLLTDNKYDLRNTYDSSNISNDKKKKLAESLSNSASAKQIYNILYTESLKDKDVLEYDDEVSDAWADMFDIASPQDVADSFKKDVKSKNKLYKPTSNECFDESLTEAREYSASDLEHAVKSQLKSAGLDDEHGYSFDFITNEDGSLEAQLSDGLDWKDYQLIKLIFKYSGISVYQGKEHKDGGLLSVVFELNDSKNESLSLKESYIRDIIKLVRDSTNKYSSTYGKFTPARFDSYYINDLFDEFYKNGYSVSYNVLDYSKDYDDLSNQEYWFEKNESLTEDTIKQNGKWVNKGSEGTHGKFKTKKAADAQRKAMFANGHKAEALEESVEDGYMKHADADARKIKSLYRKNKDIDSAFSSLGYTDNRDGSYEKEVEDNVFIVFEYDEDSERLEYNVVNEETRTGTPSNVLNLSKKLKERVQRVTEASYGGVYDIEDDMYFTKEEIVDLAYEVCDLLKKKFGYDYDIEDVYMNSSIELYMAIIDMHEVEADCAIRIDMRKIRKPSDLLKYAKPIAEKLAARFEEEYQYYDFDESLTEKVEEEQLYKIVLKSGPSSHDFMTALSEEDAEEIIEYYGGRWYDENNFEWDMYLEEDDESTERVYPFDESLNEDTSDFNKWLADIMSEPEEYVMGFNEWLLDKYGVTSDDMSDDDYDYYYKKYIIDYYRNTKEGKDYPIPECLKEGFGDYLYRHGVQPEDIQDDQDYDVYWNKFYNDLELEREREENLKESIDISDYEELRYPLKDGNKYYQLYRKLENGKGVWAAAELDKYGSDVIGEPFKITYEQARGFEPIEDSSIRRLSRDLGKRLLPKRESLNEAYRPLAIGYMILKKEIPNHVNYAEFANYDEVVTAIPSEADVVIYPRGGKIGGTDIAYWQFDAIDSEGKKTKANFSTYVYSLKDFLNNDEMELKLISDFKLIDEYPYLIEVDDDIDENIEESLKENLDFFDIVDNIPLNVLNDDICQGDVFTGFYFNSEESANRFSNYLERKGFVTDQSEDSSYVKGFNYKVSVFDNIEGKYFDDETYDESLNEAYKFIDSKKLEKNYPYYFHYESNNPFSAEDFWKYAESLGCLKVEGKYKDSQNVIFFVCPSEESYNKLLQFNKKNSLLPWIGELSNNYSNDYDQLVIKFFGKPKKLENLTEAKDTYVVDGGKLTIDKDNNYEVDFEEYDDFDNGEVIEGATFVEDGKEWAWVERIAGPIHLDFDNWAVWEAREFVSAGDFIIGTNEDGTNEVDIDAFEKAYYAAEKAYFVVDEDTGFIDWGPVETQTEAQDFLNNKVEDWEDETESRHPMHNDLFDESLKESKKLNEWWAVDLEYPDMGDYGYTYEADGDDVLEYLVELAWDNFDNYAINLPEYSYLNDLPEDEFQAWFDDEKNFEEFEEFVDAEFDMFFKKYEDRILDHFEERAVDKFYDEN